jgi:hypothetical protein
MEGGIEQNMGMSEQAFLGKTGWELSTLNMTPEDWRAHQAVLQARMPFRTLWLHTRILAVTCIGVR